MPAVLLGGAELVAAEHSFMKDYQALKKAMEVAKKQKKIHNRLKKKCFRLRNLIIPKKVYQSGTRMNENHRLINLPSEVKNMIFKALPSVPDRACLALTCKDQAAIYEQLKSETNKKDYDQKIPKRTTDVHRLQMLIRIKSYMTPIRIKPCMTPEYRLCYLCLQFIDVKDQVNQGQWGGSEARVQYLGATKMAMTEGPRCPLCVAAKTIEAVSYKDTYKKYLALAAGINFK